MKIHTKMPTPAGVVAGGTATFTLPIGRRFHELHLNYSGTSFTLAHMTEIRVNVNGKVIHTYSATERDTLNQFDGRVASAGTLVIPFERYNLKTLVAESLTALNTGSADAQGVSINQVSVEIDIASAASAPALEMYALQSDSLLGGAGTVMHVKRVTYTPQGAGNFEISDMPRGNATSIGLNRVIFVPDANSIDNIKMERNSYNIFDRPTALNSRMQTDGVRTPQAGFIIIDPSERGEGGQIIDLLGITDFRFKLEMTGACNLKMISEYIGRLGD